MNLRICSMFELAKQAAAAVDEAKLIQLCQDLIRIRSVYEPDKGGDERAVVDYLVNYFIAQGFKPISSNIPTQSALISSVTGRVQLFKLSITRHLS
ncbi:MAG: hypothetical protein R2865_03635 [Deinococcales bacterium]